MKNPPDGGREGPGRIRSLCADDVCRLEAFGALQQIKLHGLTFVERAVAVLLDGGKCTNTSSPVERWMNPYPFAPLNHFTVPFSLTAKLLSQSRRIFSGIL